MREWVKGLAVALAAAGAGYLAGTARPVAAAAPRAFEHRVVPLDYESFKTTDEYKALEKEQGGSIWLAQFAYHEKVLEAAGAQGWELVQVLAPKSPSSVTLYLRKEK